MVSGAEDIADARSRPRNRAGRLGAQFSRSKVPSFEAHSNCYGRQSGRPPCLACALWLVACVRVSDTCARAYQIIRATGFPSAPYIVGTSTFVVAFCGPRIAFAPALKPRIRPAMSVSICAPCAAYSAHVRQVT